MHGTCARWFVAPSRHRSVRIRNGRRAREACSAVSWPLGAPHIASLAEVTAAGATVKEPVRDVGGGRLVATVTDPDGNVLGLLQDR